MFFEQNCWSLIIIQHTSTYSAIDQYLYNIASGSIDNVLILLCQITRSLFSKIVIPVWIAGIQAPWMGLSLPYMALDTCFPADIMGLRINYDKA